VRKTGGPSTVDHAGQLSQDYVASHPGCIVKKNFQEMWQLDDWRTIAARTGNTTNPLQSVHLPKMQVYVLILVRGRSLKVLNLSQGTSRTSFVSDVDDDEHNRALN
jgi:hypothetical protein